MGAAKGEVRKRALSALLVSATGGWNLDFPSAPSDPRIPMPVFVVSVQLECPHGYLGQAMTELFGVVK